MKPDMKKKIFVIVCCLAGTMCLRGQVVQEQESALVYYMPQTVVDITLTYTVDSEEAGPYSRYAEKYLGAQDVISVNSQKAEIVGVRVESHSEADLSRAVKVSARDGVRMQLLSLRENGVLYGYNVGVCPAEERSEEALEVSSRVAQPETLPFTEEQLRAPGLAQQADAVAKQIYRIREARMYLLSGEIENAPADGRGLEVALKALSRQEKELVQLFTGKRIR